MSFVQFLDDARQAHSGPAELVILRRCDSTNSLARRIACEYIADEHLPPSLLVLAFEQTRGRGRMGRPWTSPPGLGVYASLVLPSVNPAQLQELPLLVGIGLCRVLQAHVRRSCGLKWPNDLLVSGRKLGGILIDTERRGDAAPVVIIGFGVNCGHTATQLPTSEATSLRLEASQVPALGRLSCELAAAIEGEMMHLGDPDYAVAHYRELSVHRRGDPLACRVGHERIQGEFAGFDDRGFLRLKTAEGYQLLSAGEVIEG